MLNALAAQCLSSDGNSMNALKELKRASFVSICIIAVVIAAMLAYWALHSRPGLAITLLPLQSPASVVTTVTFALSNSTDRAVYGWYDRPQIRKSGQWKNWRESPYVRECFWLPPGGATNAIVSIPQTGCDLRIPFAWGYDKQSALQKLVPRFHVRFSNLMSSLRNSGNVYGWSDGQGYLPDRSRFYYITNAEPRD